MGSALLVMDMQNGIVERFADRSAQLISTISSAINAARQAHVPVIFVRVALRDGGADVSPRNKTFSSIANLDAMNEASQVTQIHPGVAPLPGDVTVVKRRVSAFSGSDLDVVLRAKDIDTLVLTGLATSGVVLSTTRQAADMDFQITILSDGCADADEEVHRVLMEKVFPRQATVMTTDEWIALL
ncbi:MAG TPA: isochorismatase family cysteine hydrolase [Acidimicrobiales bacterium]|nr:isochorismatase family cysteine hydrolase [Acidimicrobiales bacterium]